LTLLVGWREGHPACKKTEWWGAGVVICLERAADLHMAQLMPLPLTVSYSSKIQIGFTFLSFWYRLTRVVSEKGPSNGRVCVYWVRVCQIIERIIELNDVADRGQPTMPSTMINSSATMHDDASWDDMDDVFGAPPPPPTHQRPHHHHQQQQQQQHLLPASARINSSAAPANTSFDIRQSAAPPVQVRETTM